MTYLRDASFMLGQDYERLVGQIEELAAPLAAAEASANGTAKAFSFKGASAKVAATGVGILSGALKALPFIGIGIALVNLVGSFARLVGNLNTSSDATDEFNERLRDLRDELDENRTAHDSNIQRIRTSNQVMQTAIDRISDLSNGENLNEGYKNRLRIATGILNVSLSEYAAALGITTSALAGNNEEALRSIQNFQTQSSHMSAMEGHLEEIIRLQEDKYYSTESLASLQEVYDNLQRGVAEYRVELEELRENNEIILGQNDGLAERYLYLAREVGAVDGEIAELNVSMAEHNMIIDDAVEGISDLEREYQITFTEMYMHVQQHGLTLGALNDVQREVIDRGIGYWQQYEEMSTEMFRRVGQSNQYSLEQVAENQYQNRLATENWQDNLVVLYEKYGAEVAAELRAMGEDGMHIVAEMADYVTNNYEEMADGTWEHLGNMADGTYSHATQIANNLTSGAETARRGMTLQLGEGFDSSIDLIEQFGSRSRTTLSQDFNAANFEVFGIAIPAGLMEGVRRNQPEAIAELERFADELGLCFRTILQINSPSGVFMEYGEGIVEGLQRGITALKSQPINLLQRAARDMKRIYNTASRDYINVGRDIMRGLNQGLLNGEAQVMSTARRIANQITVAMRQALNINSPSRVMQEEIGRQIPAGVAEGIDKYGNYATDSMYDLGNELAKVKFPSINDVINMGPSLSLAGAGASSMITNHNNNQSHSYAGLFDGATINWHGEEDIRRTMEKMARAAEEDAYRMWFRKFCATTLKQRCSILDTKIFRYAKKYAIHIKMTAKNSESNS